MITRDAEAVWSKSLQQGNGTIRFGSFEGPYSFATRFETAEGTNPEELIGAAHAGCFSMALALVLGKAGHEPVSIRTAATVYLDAGRLALAKIALRTSADVPGIDEAAFRKYAEEAEQICPVSKALAGVEIVLEEARLGRAEQA